MPFFSWGRRKPRGPVEAHPQEPLSGSLGCAPVRKPVERAFTSPVALATYADFVQQRCSTEYYASILRAVQARATDLGYEAVRVEFGDPPGLPPAVFDELAQEVVLAGLRHLSPWLDEFSMFAEAEMQSGRGVGASLLKSILSALGQRQLFLVEKESLT